MPDAHLLLVDDSPDVRMIVAYLCKRAGIRLDACPAVAPAWEYLQQTRPALVLLDVQMPPVSGLELCRQMRAADEPLRSMPVALFTHWGVPGDVVAGLEAGADYVVSKDLLTDPPQWQRRVREILVPAGGPQSKSFVTYALAAAATSSPPPRNWEDVLNLALHGVLVRRVGSEVARIVVRRALEQAAARAEVLLFGSGDGAVPLAWAALVRPEAVFLMAAALADQLGRLLGSEESSTFRAALAPLLQGHEDGPTP